MENEIGGTFLKLDHRRFDDRRNRVSARPHPRAINLVPRIDDRNIADHIAAFIREKVQLFAQRFEKNFAILNDGVALALVVKSGLFRSLNVVLEHIVETTNTRRFTHFNKAFSACGDESRLHKTFRLREIEELAIRRFRSHLKNALLFVEGDVA